METNWFNKLFKNIYEEVDYRIWCVKHWYLSLRSWFRYCWNKHHFKFVWTAFVNRPYDVSSMYQCELAQLYDMLHYFENGKYIVQEEYDKICMQIRRSISLLEIGMGLRETFHYDGDFKFEEIQDERFPGKKLYQLNDKEKPKYFCDVTVNLRNMDRYVKDETFKKFIRTHPHDLYELKAMQLYFKSKAYYSSGWAD